MADTNSNLMKCMHTITVNVVRGCSYEIFTGQKFVIRKFYDRKNFQIYSIPYVT